MPLKKIFLFLFSFFGFVVVGSAQDNRIWATYYGGEGSEGAANIKIDNVGNIYLTGFTDSDSAIASGGFQDTIGGGKDAFLVKFDTDGNRVWATYYGGEGNDYGLSLAIDTFGNSYLAGRTNSLNGIASGGFQNTFGGGGSQIGFLVKFDSLGNRIWGTYYGANPLDGYYAVSVSPDGNIYLAGTTWIETGISSGGFQNSYGGGFSDAFLVKFDADGNRIWATYYGGNQDDNGFNVATDAFGNVYLTGNTPSVSGIASGGFQNTIAGGYDAFLVKFDAGGNRLWATYYGGSSVDQGIALSADINNNVYMTGSTYSSTGISSGDFQDTFAGGFDVFLAKFNANGNRIWATYYGGANNDESESVYTDTLGNVYLAGDSYSPSGIASQGFQNNLAGMENEFVAKFDSTGHRLCATYYGQNHDESGHVAVDMSGNVYLTGQTNSASGIAFNGFQNTLNGTYDAYLVKFSTCPNVLTLNIASINPGCNQGCTGSATANPAYGTAPYSYFWSNSQTTQTITEICPGTYTVTVTDAADSSVTDSLTIDDGIILSFSISQSGDTLSATTAPNYQWYLNDTIITGATSQNYIIHEGGNYYVVTSTDSCTFTSNVIETSCLCVGIDENSLFQSISLFPNPANEYLNIIVQLSNAEAASIKLTDAFGRNVYQKTETQKATSFNWQIPLSGFAAGIYFTEITVLGQKQYRKIAVQR